MKEFLLKYKIVIAVVVLLGLFVLLSVLMGDKELFSKEMGSDVQEWLTASKSDEYVVTVLGQTTCPHCINFKPVMASVNNEYDFKLYWFEIDVMSKNDKEGYNALMNTYNLDGYQGTPYTFITKNGEFVDYTSGGKDKDTLIEFLKKNGVIE